jgi:DNA excision repair protein ERCC-1
MSLPQKRRFQLPSDEDLAQLNEVSTIVPRVPSRASSLPTPIAEPIVDEHQQSTVSATTSTSKTSKTTIRTNATSHSFTSVYEKTVKVNRNQNGNPVLKLIRNVPWQFEDGIVPDYVVGE